METKLTSGFLFLLLLHLPTSVAQVDDPGGVQKMKLKLNCPEILVKAEIGHDVTLNCSSKPQHDLTDDMLGWKFNETITVLLYKYKRFLYSWEEQFKYRAHPDSSWDVSEGKLSLKISSVTENDAGIYECFVHINEMLTYCRAELIVGHQEDNKAGQTENPAEDPDDDKSLGPGAITAVVVALIALVLIIIVHLWRKRKNHSGHGGGDDKTTEGDRRNSVPEEVPLQSHNN